MLKESSRENELHLSPYCFVEYLIAFHPIFVDANIHSSYFVPWLFNRYPY
jgi:hypothetical protein